MPVAPLCVEAHHDDVEAVAYLFAFVPAGAGDKPGRSQRVKDGRHARLVVAFRGAASLEDALCGSGALPVPLASASSLFRGAELPLPQCVPESPRLPQLPLCANYQSACRLVRLPSACLEPLASWHMHHVTRPSRGRRCAHPSGVAEHCGLKRE